MHIIADENIPYIKELFAALGTVHTINGRQITRADVNHAEMLLVRSVTPVNADLLAGSRVQFVGTATIGCDHVDTDYLQKQGIAFASAPGSNATSTAEYVISALLIIAQQQGFQLQDKTVGIIGCGNVGSTVLKKLQALNIHCLVYDPPLQEKTGNTHFVNLDDILATDIITLHVPLEKTGRYPTYHLVNTEFLAKLRNNVILVNTSRGQVVDETALLSVLNTRPNMQVILDVWQNEPHINPLLLQRVILGTPHIAGYSFDGKVRGTTMLYSAACQHFKLSPTFQSQPHLPEPALTRLTFSNTVEAELAIYTAVLACYDVRRDSSALRLFNQSSQLVTQFDKLRKQYPVRREFSSLEIVLPQEKTDLVKQLLGLGFRVISVTNLAKINCLQK